MADSLLVLNNNRNSKLINVLNTLPLDNRHYQDIGKNVPNCYKSITNINHFNNVSSIPVSGSKYIFKIDSSNFLRKLAIQTNIITNGVNYNIPVNIGYYLYKSIELRQNDNVLFSNNIGYLKNRVVDTVYDHYTTYNNMTIINNIKTTAVDAYCYTPIFSWIFENEKNNICLDFNKGLELHVEYNDNLDWTNLTSISPTLKMFRYCYEEDYINTYIQKNFFDNLTNYFIYDTFLLNKNVSTGTTSTRIEISSKLLVNSIHLSMFLDSNYNEVEINSVIVKLGDRVIYDSERYMNLINSDDIPSANGSNQFSIYFGQKIRDGHSGSLDMSSIPIFIEITHNDPGENSTIYCNLEHFKILQLHKNNGVFISNSIH